MWGVLKNDPFFKVGQGVPHKPLTIIKYNLKKEVVSDWKPHAQLSIVSINAAQPTTGIGL